MKYERPAIRDLGSIAQHTFTAPGLSNKATRSRADTDRALEVGPALSPSAD